MPKADTKAPKRETKPAIDETTTATATLPRDHNGELTMMRLIPVRDIRANPRNPRGAVKPEDVQELAASIRINGILQPLAVREDGKGWVVLIGERRRVAASVAGLTNVPAWVLEGDQAHDVEIALVENTQREDLDPLAMARAVAGLLAVKGATLDGVAGTLGRTRSWVQQRAQLARLSPKAKAAREKGLMSEWPIEWLLDFAALAPDGQDELLGSQWTFDRVTTRKELREVLRDQTAKLADAPWDLEDATLVPVEGSCVKCHRHSAASPGLFDDKGADDLKTAICRDAPCYGAKLNAFRGRTVKEKRAELGPKMIVISESHLDERDKKGLQKAIGQPVSDSYMWQPAKKTDPGAVPAIVITAEGTKVTWKKKGGYGAGSSGGRTAGKAKPSSMADLRAALAKRRGKAAVAECLELLLKTDHKAIRDDDHLLELVAAFGCDPIEVDNGDRDKSDAWQAMHLATVPRRKAVWEAVRGRLIHDHLRGWMLDRVEAAELMAELEEALAIPWKRVLAEQVEKIPEPRSWADKPAPAKRKAKPKAAAPAKSVKGKKLRKAS